ncbi:IS66 family insertion sequence element accessory protein TnpB [Sphingomonas abietis]|uniref:IS66 family insertion sequence element accessory protein TnpB n=1 Tax=Sphingomonas abietis TaxID=3012344 RepID=A0ABY7NP99_9SPHN|nr:IS66 family insertion sequence element accessory protein TnpB [Sphingomonas abietis]WBO23364.1 IS66 family insertion sequence element accessory protein TnpB [Sphingomonas abietis]
MLDTVRDNTASDGIFSSLNTGKAMLFRAGEVRFQADGIFIAEIALMVQQQLHRDPHGGDLFVFRGRIGSLVKIIWHDGLGMSLYAKRLEKGRFVWPSAKDGVVSLTASQLACLLEGIDWRNPQYSWRPASAG